MTDLLDPARPDTVVPGTERLNGRTVHFDDGTAGEFDTIVWATGLHTTLPFLDDALVERDEGVPVRTAGGIFPAALDRLYLIGLAAPRGPQTALYPLQSELALTMAEQAPARCDEAVAS